jgi:chemotaxis protein MotB
LARDLAQAAKGQDGVSVRLADDGVRIDLQSAAFFDTASAVLKPQALDPLAPILARIRSTSYSIDVEGHSDDRDYYRRQGDEIETNWSLSGRRAASVVNYLKETGFNENRLRIVGYASNKPQVETKGLNDQQLEEARAKNRRVSLLVR